MTIAQCPVCALRFRYQSELEQHAHDAHCTEAEVHLPPHAEHAQSDESDQPASRLLRLP